MNVQCPIIPRFESVLACGMEYWIDCIQLHHMLNLFHPSNTCFVLNFIAERIECHVSIESLYYLESHRTTCWIWYAPSYWLLWFQLIDVVPSPGVGLGDALLVTIQLLLKGVIFSLEGHNLSPANTPSKGSFKASFILFDGQKPYQMLMSTY